MSNQLVGAARGRTRSGSRILSHTEISKALDCEAAWDLAYGGHLAGAALRPKVVAPTLGAGRAWGAAVAAWHGAHSVPRCTPLPGFAPAEAKRALIESLDRDAEKMESFGVYDHEQRLGLESNLIGCLDHYMATAEPLPITRLEGEFQVPVPSRTRPGRASNLYRFLAYVDGLHTDINDGRVWIAEFKFRAKLTNVLFISRSRQLRWYAWAYWRQTGTKVAGVITDERLNEAPKPPRLVKAKRKSDPQDADGLTPSHAKDQLCTAADYIALCAKYGTEVNEETREALSQRHWQQRVRTIFRDGELDEAGRELVSAAQKIADLDSGRRYPLRNVKQFTCARCQFSEICDAPDDSFLVDTVFERTTPKRLRREAREEAA